MCADRTLSNAINITGHFATANAPSQNFNLNLTGPITMTSTVNRSIFNNMTGTLTLGKSTVGDSTQPVTLSGTAAQTLTFTGGANSATVVNDVIQNGGSGLIPGSLAISASTVRFNNANTYGPSAAGTTTNTTVSGTGKLLVMNTSGSGTGSGNVSVTGGTLGGTGTISQSVSATGGAIAPGDPSANNGVGTLNIGTNLTFSNTAGLSVELGGTTAGSLYDQVLITGTASVASASGGTLTVSLVNGFSPSVDTDFTVLTATGGLTTNLGAGFGNFVYPDLTHWTTNYTANSVVVHYSAAGSASPLEGGAVPEPGSIALVLGAIALASRRHVDSAALESEYSTFSRAMHEIVMCHETALFGCSTCRDSSAQIIASSETSKPNLVVFIADDHGYLDSSVTGAKNSKRQTLTDLPKTASPSRMRLQRHRRVRRVVQRF